MSLIKIDGQPGLYRDTDTGQIVNIRDFQKLDHIVAFDAWQTPSFSPRAGEAWMVDAVSVLLHPWPEVIPTGFRFNLTVAGVTVLEASLRNMAEPLQRDVNQDLLQRLERLEKTIAMYDQYGRPTDLQYDHAGDLRKLVHPRMVSQIHGVCARLAGDADEMMLFRERIKTCELSLRGLRRAPVGHR